MKCLRCKTEDIKTTTDVIGEPSYYCENCGATYTLVDDSGC